MSGSIVRTRTTAEHADDLRGIAPRGRIWDRGATRWGELIDAIAATFRRDHSRDVNVISEAIPGTVVDTISYPSETLAAWEAEFGIEAGSLTVAQRRAQLLGHLRARGGNSEAYFVALAGGLGVTVTIDSFPPWSPLSPPCYPMAATWERFVFTITGPAALAGSTVAAQVEALFEQHRQATDYFIFSWTAP